MVSVSSPFSLVVFLHCDNRFARPAQTVRRAKKRQAFPGRRRGRTPAADDDDDEEFRPSKSVADAVTKPPRRRRKKNPAPATAQPSATEPIMPEPAFAPAFPAGAGGTGVVYDDDPDSGLEANALTLAARGVAVGHSAMGEDGSGDEGAGLVQPGILRRRCMQDGPTDLVPTHGPAICITAAELAHYTGRPGDVDPLAPFIGCTSDGCVLLVCV